MKDEVLKYFMFDEIESSYTNSVTLSIGSGQATYGPMLTYVGSLEPMDLF
jgi:hypothetical protein